MDGEEGRGGVSKRWRVRKREKEGEEGRGGVRDGECGVWG